MKKPQNYVLISILFFAAAIMAFTSGDDDLLHIKSSSGAPAGYSGDPAGGNKNCTNCHSGTAVQQAGLITSNVPGTGYVPGTTYTITTTAAGDGITKFGFQVSPQNSGGTILGTLINTSDNTKLVSGTDYVTHTSVGNAGANEKVWTFDWTAPDAGSGEVTFYGAVNLANNNGGNSGDEILLSTLTISEEESTSILERDIQRSFNVYPNPATDYITIEAAGDLQAFGYAIFDQAGREMLRGPLHGRKTTVNIDHLKAGIYYMQVEGAENETLKFIRE